MTKIADKDLEIEVKFFIEDEQTLQSKIVALGGVTQGRAFETNIRYDDPMQTLKSRRCLLRLRKDAQARLTVKTDAVQENSEFKIMRELEVAVSDFDTMDRILITLGFQRAQIYEKWRETITLNKVILCLDALPFGTFLEIEGDREEIRAAARALGLDWNLRILSNYLEIFGYLRRQEGFVFTDVTFENFKTHPIEFHAYRKIFETGMPERS